MALSIYSPPFDSNAAGEIKGSSTDALFADHIEWFACSHELVAPFEEASGLPIGKRQHRPFTAIKRLDRSSPLLQDTLTKNGTIGQIEFKFFRPDDTGAAEHYYNITLEEARISSIRIEQLNNRYPGNQPFEPWEHVSFVYDKITWEEVVAGIMGFDSWRQTRRAL